MNLANLINDVVHDDYDGNDVVVNDDDHYTWRRRVAKIVLVYSVNVVFGMSEWFVVVVVVVVVVVEGLWAVGQHHYYYYYSPRYYFLPPLDQT